MHESVCTIMSYISGRSLFTSWRWVKMQPITTICMLTSVTKSSLSLTTTVSCVLSHNKIVNQVICHSNASILNKTHPRVSRSPRVQCNNTHVIYCDIAWHPRNILWYCTAQEKYCCRNMNIENWPILHENCESFLD